jgi:hypothetical protein
VPSKLTRRDAPRDVRNAARAQFEMDFDARWPLFPPREVYKDVLSNRSQFKGLSGDAMNPECVEHLRPGPQLHPEDLATPSYLRLLLEGPARVRDRAGRETSANMRFDHIAIDEAQDLAPPQFSVLRAHAAGLTITGDLAQSVTSWRLSWRARLG